MDIFANVEWYNAARLDQMKKHLSPYSIDKKEALEKILGVASERLEKRVQLSLYMGTYESLSYFIFLEGTGNTSEVVGYCPSNQMKHIWGDFTYLRNQMDNSDIFHTIRNIHLRIDGQKLYKKSLRQYVCKRTIIKDLIILPGGLTILSHYLYSGIIKMDFITFISGLLLWVFILCIGYLTEGEYVIK